VATLIPLPADDVTGLADFADRESIDLTVVGPEGPLVAGLVDELTGRGMRAFGPSSVAARIEGSKAWARRLCERHGIPGPVFREFVDANEALAYLEGLDPPVVVKADGLAAGKGVTVAEDLAAAALAVEDCLVRGAFGDAGARVVIEECLDGPEVSALALVAGRQVIPLALAQDFKRALDGNLGPNTGGMGAYSPVPFVDRRTASTIQSDVLEATAAALVAEGVEFRGVLYAGLILTNEGPKVLEFNCRLGDPETQVVLPRLESDLLELLLACAEGDLASAPAPDWRTDACVGVVLASGGYPGPVEAGKPLSGLAEATGMPGVHVFHSGSAEREGRVVTAGGRVLTVSALGPSIEEARARAYEAVARISFDGMQHRSDIALDLPQAAPR
jgi:phosphoribosylamine--glycine ligase